MLILSLNPNIGGTYNAKISDKIYDKYLYYNIIKDDYNNDGLFNNDDPSFLFISERSGANLKQISPDNLDLISWELLPKTNKLILQCLEDSNKDKKFDNEDVIITYIYDLEKDKLEKIFDKDFIIKLNKIFKNQWPSDKE